MDTDPSHRRAAPRSAAAPHSGAGGGEDDAAGAVPMVSDAAQEQEPTSVDMTTSKGTRADPVPLRLGVLEDSYTTLRLVIRTFRERGHHVDHFANLDDAWEALSRGGYHALIVSDTMAGGAEACQSVIARVRSRPEKAIAAIPILALTARGDTSRRRVLEVLGASSTLSELTEARLAAALSAALDHAVPAAAAPQERRVLLLEDSYSLSLLLSDVLVRAGRAVDHFATADQAIAALDEHDYEALILSQNDKPNQLSCVQLIEYARSIGQSGAGALRILVLTENPGPENVNALRRAGAERVLHKKNPAQLGKYLLSLLEGQPAVPRREADTSVSAAPIAATPAVAADSGVEPPRRKFGVAPAVGHSSPWYGGVALVAVLLGIGWLAWQLLWPAAVVNVVSVERGTVTRTLSAAGHVVSKRQVELAPSQTGQLYRVFANEGDLARKGETLATLDNREATINVRRAEAQVFRYRTEVNLADKALKALRAQADPADSRQAVLEFESARAMAAARLRIVEQDLQAAQLAVERLSIVAPFAGVLTQSFAIEGKWVEAGTPVYTLADLDAQEVALRVDVASAPEVAAGESVRLTLNGEERDDWEGKVLRVIVDEAAGTGAAQRASATVYASLGEDAPALAFGQRVHAEIITDTVSDAVTVPFDALVLRDGQHFVAVVNSDRVELRPVEVGIQSLASAEIRAGLAPGESVILSGRSLKDGQRVVINSAPAAGVATAVASPQSDAPEKSAQ